MVRERHQNVTRDVADRSLSWKGVDSVLRISVPSHVRDSHKNGLQEDVEAGIMQLLVGPHSWELL